MAKSHQKTIDSLEKWELILYTSTGSLTSRQAESAMKNICEKYLQGRYTLEVIDINVDIEAVPLDILVVPTIIRKSPSPERRVIGSLSESDKLLAGLGLDVSLL